MRTMLSVHWLPIILVVEIFDVLRHDNVCGHFPVDVYLLVGRQMYGYACDKAYYQKNSGFHIGILKCYYNFLCCIQIYYLASSEFIR